MHTYTLDDVTQDEAGYTLITPDKMYQGQSPESLVRLANAIVKGRQREASFLEAWRAAVQLAGEEYFQCRSTSVESATDKNDLAPDLDFIIESAGVLSSGERTFLLAIVQLYNDQAVFDLCEEHGIRLPSLADLAILDEDHRRVISQLLETYVGW